MEAARASSLRGARAKWIHWSSTHDSTERICRNTTSAALLLYRCRNQWVCDPSVPDLELLLGSRLLVAALSAGGVGEAAIRCHASVATSSFRLRALGPASAPVSARL